MDKEEKANVVIVIGFHVCGQGITTLSIILFISYFTSRDSFAGPTILVTTAAGVLPICGQIY